MGLLEDLSAAFVAFTIEVDDAAETRLRHRTTRGGDGRDPSKGTWLASLAMWRNCMQWLPAEGISVAELLATARTPTNLGGMRRWGYIRIEGLPRGTKGRPRLEALVRPTKRGAREQRVWDGLPEEIEARWAERFGTDAVGKLRAALVALVGGPDAADVSGPQQPKDAPCLDPALPDTMPIVRHAWSTRRDEEPEGRPGPVAVADLGLDSLLARPLTALALEYEASGKLPAALQVNLIAVLGAEPSPLRDLPDATGIHRAQIDNAVGYLERAKLAEIVPAASVDGDRSRAVNVAGAKRSGSAAASGAAAKRGKSAALTARGEKAKAAGAAKLAKLEAGWDERHGEAIARVREALAPIAAGGGPASPLLAGLEHPPGTWRAESRPLARLPRFPLVTHRGGFPDGA